jgi:hypothetical protein
MRGSVLADGAGCLHGIGMGLERETPERVHSFVGPTQQEQRRPEAPRPKQCRPNYGSLVGPIRK